MADRPLAPAGRQPCRDVGRHLVRGAVKRSADGGRIDLAAYGGAGGEPLPRNRGAAGSRKDSVIGDHGAVTCLIYAEIDQLTHQALARIGGILTGIEHDAVAAGGDRFGQ